MLKNISLCLFWDSNQCPGLLSLQWPEFPAHPLLWKSFLSSLFSSWWHFTGLQVRCKWRWGTKRRRCWCLAKVSCPFLGRGQAASCKESSHKSSKLVGRLQMMHEISRQTLQASLWKGQPQNYHLAPEFSTLNPAGFYWNHLPLSHPTNKLNHNQIFLNHREKIKRNLAPCSSNILSFRSWDVGWRGTKSWVKV